MDYLMSLLGKDQETVVEALKTLAENGERLKVTEKELEEVKIEIEDLKDENQQNQKKIKDLKDDLHYERNFNEDLETDLKKAERQVDIFKHGIGINKDSIIDGLDKILKEKGDEMNKLRFKIENEKLNVKLEQIVSTKETISLAEELNNLNIHLINPFKCETCEKEFEQKRDLRMHMKIQHEEFNEKNTSKAKLKEIEILFYTFHI